MATADLVVRIITDTSQAKGFDQATGKAGKFGSAMGKLAAPAGLALAGIVAFGAGAVKAASDTEQAMGAVDSVFGKSAGQVKAWADNAAQSVGLAESEYASMAATLGSQLKNMGIPMDELGGRTNSLIKKGADLSAMFGGTTKEAVEALGSALRGETDPIERYGVSIKEADIAAQMAKEGTDKLTGAAAKQAKTMALLHLINKQTADSTGTFKDEQDTAAGSAQTMAATMKDLQSDMGTALLPIVSKLAKAMGKLAKYASENTTEFQIIIGVIAGVAAAILVLNVAVTIYTAVTTLAASATFMMLLPWILIGLAILGVVAIFVILWKKCDAFRNAVKAVWSAMKAGAKAVASFLKAVFKAVWRYLSTAVKAYGAVVKAIWRVIKAGAQTIIGWLKSAWKAMWAVLKAAGKAYLAAVKAVWSAIKGAAQNVIGWLKSAWRACWDAVKTVVRTVSGVVKTAMQGIRTAVQYVVQKVQDLIAKIRDIGVPGAVVGAFNAVKNAADNVLGVIKDIVTWIRNIPTPHIDWPSPPKWLPGVNMAAAGAPAVAGFAAPGVPVASGRAGGSGAPIVINVTGALDPEAVARQIQRVLTGHNRRVGLRVVAQ